MRIRAGGIGYYWIRLNGTERVWCCWAAFPGEATLDSRDGERIVNPPSEIVIRNASRLEAFDAGWDWTWLEKEIGDDVRRLAEREAATETETGARETCATCRFWERSAPSWLFWPCSKRPGYLMPRTHTCGHYQPREEQTP